MPSRREIAGRIDSAIGERNATELAKRLGVTRQAVSNWRTGFRLPDPVRLAALCRALDKSADSLLGVTPTAQEEPAASDEVREAAIGRWPSAPAVFGASLSALVRAALVEGLITREQIEAALRDLP